MTIRELYERAEREGFLDKEIFVYSLHVGGRVATGGKVDSIQVENDAVFLWNEEA